MIKDKGEEYLMKFPHLQKWINECVVCHRKGYSPNLPNRISVVEGAQDVYYLKKYYDPLYVNEDGLCKVCEKLLVSKENKKEV